MIKVVIAGASGRMGKTLLEAVAGAPDLRLHGALDRSGSPLLGRDAGELVGAPQIGRASCRERVS
jgi:4-hydroxy-tetrahydrodipicolinate reductase